MQACMSCTEYNASSSAASDFRRSNYSLRKGLLSIPPSDGGGRRPHGQSFPKVHLAPPASSNRRKPRTAHPKSVGCRPKTVDSKSGIVGKLEKNEPGVVPVAAQARYGIAEACSCV
jgi:hypothetical protein